MAELGGLLASAILKVVCLRIGLVIGDRIDLHPLPQNRSLFQTICPACLWIRDKRCLLSRVQRLAGLAGG